ncbi:MAG: putative lipid II flippase FtsW [Defluviitaleaceae bacterium]|nr:putative lipid II flippase FtsW [Defluviitaleaceae bacterium]MCL2835653.1 putative lipid II flippase FtsW [Defluviitaleaceae bacterium]
MESTYGRGGKQASAKTGGGKSRITITEVDGVIVATVFVLLLIGIIMVFSSSYYTAMTKGQSMFSFFIGQSRAALLGIVAMIVMSKINYRIWGKLTPIMYLASIVLLIYTGFFGKLVNGARRWIEIPVFGSFQTVEFVKLALILFLSFLFYHRKDMLKSWVGIGIASIITLVPAAIAWQHTDSLSSGITLAAIGFGMIFIASPYFWRFIGLLGVAFVGMVSYLTFSTGHQSRRFATFGNPWADPLGAGYQTIQSLYAVASGGLFGLGLGNSRQKLMYMIEPHNDFIFAIICEELGLVGASVVILLFCILIYRGVRVAMNAADMLGTLIATGIVVMITVQVIINIGVVTDTVPNTGVPLPFVSYGGTSILFLMAMVGILLNVSRYTRKRG